MRFRFRAPRCSHDWEVIEKVATYEIYFFARRGRLRSERERGIEDHFCVRKVCLKCGMAVDEVSEYLRKCVDEYAREKTRRSVAMEIYRASGLPLGELDQSLLSGNGAR